MKRKISVLLIAFLTLIGTAALISQPQAYYNSNGQFWITGLSEPTRSLNSFTSPFPSIWGVYFWEYPDGNFEIYNYKKWKDKVSPERFKEAASHPKYKGNTTIKKGNVPGVYLTPFNSGDASRKIPIVPATKTVREPVLSPRPSNIRPEPVNWEKSIAINASTDKAVPGNMIRVAVSYKGSKGTSGTLTVLYNASEGLINSESPFSLSDPSQYFGESLIGKKLDPNLGRFQDKGYTGCTVYNVRPMQNEVQHFFFTLTPAVGLNPRKESGRIFLRVIWRPNTDGISKADMAFALEKAHDPNNIKGPKAAYRKNECSEKLEYKLAFENRGRRAADTVRIELLITKGFVANSFKIIDFKHSLCTGCSANLHNKAKGCPNFPYFSYKINKDTIILNFDNFWLPGKQGLFKRKYSKSWVKFSIDQKDRFTKIREGVKARIFFPDNEPVSTGKTRTQWRGRTLSIERGYAFGLNQSTSIPKTIDGGGSLFQQVGIAVAYQDAPLSRGLIKGVELGMNSFSFIKNGADALYESDQTNLFKISYLHASATAGYQFVSYFRLQGGVGIVLPILAEEGLYSLDWVRSGYGDSYSLEYGLFQKRRAYNIYHETTGNSTIREVFAGTFSARLTPGFIGQLGIEFSLMNNLVLGIENQIRHLPRFYTDKSVTLSNFNVYVQYRLQLPPKRKKKC